VAAVKAATEQREPQARTLAEGKLIEDDVKKVER
jgi:hypothetical protein